MAQHDTEVVIIGGGQAGLAIGYELMRRGREFVILDASPAIGHAWRNRWDSLRLFTPSSYNDLPGMPFPIHPNLFPTKDQVASYLAAYAARFGLPVRLQQRVTSVEIISNGYRIETATDTYRARGVVIATGPFHQPYIPRFSADLPQRIYQIHSSQYRNPQQLPPGRVLVVGAGNSGMQIAEELAGSHPVALAVGRWLPHVPKWLYRRASFWRVYFQIAQLITTASPLGRVLRNQDTVFGVSLHHLRRAHGVTIVGRVLGVADEQIIVQRGQPIKPNSLIWATGFRPQYDWLHVPVLDRNGAPQHQRGLTAAPGLYFLGLHWQSYAGSSMLGGVGRDAAFIAEHLTNVVQDQPK